MKVWGVKPIILLTCALLFALWMLLRAARLSPGINATISSVSEVNGEAPVIVSIFPEIHELSDLNGMTPLEFLELLKVRRYDEYIFYKKLQHWISKEDVALLLPLTNSKDPCSPVALASSSYYSSKNSTIGQEALFMLEGYRKGQYPPSLNSVLFGGGQALREELIGWCRNEVGAKEQK